MTIADNIRERREEYELSQYDLADRTGLSRSYIAKVENGLGIPSLDAAIKIANALNISLDRLTGRKAAS